MSTLKKIHAYARRLPDPTFWPTMARNVLRRADPTARARRERQRAAREATAGWCDRRAVTAEQALALLGVDPAGMADLHARHGRTLAEARRRVEACPVAMGGGGNIGFLYALCGGTGARRVVETGVAYGWSTLALLLALDGRPGAHLYSVDLPYVSALNDGWVGVAVPEAMRHNWTLYRMADRRGLPRARRAGAPFDLAHYDSDKSYRGRRWAYATIWAGLRPGGVLVSDDISDNMAFAEFAAAVGVEPVVVRDAGEDGKYQGVIVKPAG